MYAPKLLRLGSTFVAVLDKPEISVLQEGGYEMVPCVEKRRLIELSFSLPTAVANNSIIKN